MILDVDFATDDSVPTRHGFVADRHVSDKRNAKRVRFEHEFQAPWWTLTAHGDLCEFVSFRTIVGELTLGTRMRRLCRSSCFRRRHVSCVGRHTITVQRSVCRSGISQRTSSVPQRAVRTYSLLQRSKPLRAI